MRRRGVPVWWLVGTLVGAVVVSVGVGVLTPLVADSFSFGGATPLTRTEWSVVDSPWKIVEFSQSGWLADSSYLSGPGGSTFFEGMQTRSVRASSPVSLADPVGSLTFGDDSTAIERVVWWESSRTGLPFRSAWYSRGSLVDGSEVTEARLYRVGIKRLPVGVLWGGLVGNVLVYWAALLGLGELVRWARRRLRGRRGRCAGCGYSMAGLEGVSGDAAVCPECGEKQGAGAC